MALVMTDTTREDIPEFGSEFREKLTDLFRWRRDVRRFRNDHLTDDVLDYLLQLASLAPSVGNSQPWRFVKVEDAFWRKSMRDIFEAANLDAQNDYAGEHAKL